MEQRVKTASASDSIDEVLGVTPNLPVEELIPEVIRVHTEDGCGFFDNASQRILANYYNEFSELTLIKDSPGYHRLCTFFNYEENFCPREGVDKMAYIKN
jgi:hypothetical protein